MQLSIQLGAVDLTEPVQRDVLRFGVSVSEEDNPLVDGVLVLVLEDLDLGHMGVGLQSREEPPVAFGRHGLARDLQAPDRHRSLFYTGSVYIVGMPDWPKNLDGGMSPDEDLLLEPLSLEDQFAKDVQTLRGPRPEPFISDAGVPRMSKERLKQFVLDILDGRIFTSDQINRTTSHECSECDRPCGNLDERGASLCCGAVPRTQVRWGVEPQLVFLPLAFLDRESLERLMKFEQEIGCFWGPMKSTLPRGLNGYPMLMEMGIMHVEDWAKVRKVLVREQQRRQDLDLDDE